jgi:nucleotide-binding universal stress UspA family protein/CBS domain-containing protein
MNPQRILYPTDFSPCARLAFGYATELARKTGARLHLLHVVPLYAEGLDDPIFGELYPFEACERAERAAVDALAALADSMAAADIEVVVAIRRSASAAAAILDYADEQAIDVVVMGTHGRHGPARLLLGSQAEEVLRSSTCPVLAVREDEHGTAQGRELPPREILAPFDLAPRSRPALAEAADLARRWGARLRLLHVRELPVSSEEADAEGKLDLIDRLEGELALAAGSAFGRVELRDGRPSEEILRASRDEQVDLVVMGTGASGIRRRLFGSTAEEVLRIAGAPVLVVPTPEEKSPLRRLEATRSERRAVTPGPLAQQPAARSKAMKVEDVMQREPVMAKPEMTLDRAGQRMAEVDCGFLPVVDDRGKVVGVLTDRDVCLALTSRNRRPAEVEVRQVMSHNVASCLADDNLGAALQLMGDRKVRRLPVVEPDGRLSGILSVDDVLIEARRGGEAGHPSFEEVAATLQTICRHVILAVR